MDRAKELRVALFSIIVGTAVIIIVLNSFDVAEYHNPSAPSFFPLLLAYLLLMLGGGGLCRSMLAQKNKTEKQAVPPAEVMPLDSNETNQAGKVLDDEHSNSKSIVGIAVLFVYGYCIFYLGYWVASAMAIFCLGVLLHQKRTDKPFLIKLGAVALIAPVAISFVFSVFAAVRLPTWGLF